jgi:SAM-dependent methyltransferase
VTSGDSEHQASELWDAEAAAFDIEPDHGLRDPAVRGAWRTLLVSLLPPVPARVADLGCGTGTLSELLAAEGYAVDGVDFSPEMVRRATAKAGSYPGTAFTVGDAADPPLPRRSYDVVLCRHVLWALADPRAALGRWVDLLAPEGRLVLVEGSWSTGAGLSAAETVALLDEAGRPASVRRLVDPAYWGRPIEDERYVVVA